LSPQNATSNFTSSRYCAKAHYAVIPFGLLSSFELLGPPLLCGAVIGTILNASGILIGGAIGFVRRKAFPPTTEAFFKVMLGVFTVYYGLRLTWLSLDGSGLQISKQLVILILSLMLGKLTGRLLGLQKLSNRIGQAASERIVRASAAKPGQSGNPADGFKTCAALFCAAPLGLIGAVTDGLSGYYWPLAIKGVMDALATLGFVRLFGWGSLLALVPVVALQGSITLVGQGLLPFLEAHSSGGHELVNSLNGVAGLMIFSVALVILELKKIELADYLPGLIVAPLIAWLWR
jgi:uncharacterized membrane protein YqgA involved in biofilm formation